jgi:hypothetical protein
MPDLINPETCSLCLIEVEWEELQESEYNGNLCLDCWEERDLTTDEWEN